MPHVLASFSLRIVVRASGVAVCPASDCALRHSFEIAQMPANLLEIVGLDTAPAMHKAGLKVHMTHETCFLHSATRHV